MARLSLTCYNLFSLRQAPLVSLQPDDMQALSESNGGSNRGSATGVSSSTATTRGPPVVHTNLTGSVRSDEVMFTEEKRGLSVLKCGKLRFQISIFNRTFCRLSNKLQTFRIRSAKSFTLTTNLSRTKWKEQKRGNGYVFKSTYYNDIQLLLVIRRLFILFIANTHFPYSRSRFQLFLHNQSHNFSFVWSF